MHNTLLQWFKCGSDFCTSLTSSNRHTCNRSIHVIEDCKNYKQWSTNPQTVREAFYEDSQRIPSFDNDSSSFSYDGDLFKSTCHEGKYQFTLQSKNQQEPYDNDEERNMDNMNDNCMIDKPISNEEVYNDKEIRELANPSNEINESLATNIDPCDSNDVDHLCKSSCKIILSIFDSIFNTVTYILFCLFKSNSPSTQSINNQIDKTMDDPKIQRTQQKSQFQTYAKFTSGDDPTPSSIAQVNYYEENTRLKMLVKVLARRLKRRENDLRQLVLDLRNINEKLIKDPC